MAFGVGKSGTCTPKNYIFVVLKANSEGEKVLSTMLFSPEWVFRSRVLEQYLHCKLRGWRKVFTTNLMSVDLLQNTPKTRKPIAERTSHKWHGYTTRGAAVSAAPNNYYSSHGMHGTHRTFLQRKDSHGWYG